MQSVLSYNAFSFFLCFIEAYLCPFVQCTGDGGNWKYYEHTPDDYKYIDRPCGKECRHGGCRFNGCISSLKEPEGVDAYGASCQGGLCEFIGCKNPTCRGGACTFVNCEGATCDG
eukprot:11011979-Ditylum_brightwellii.AAC.1